MKTNREEILKAALIVFSQKGYDGALLRDISDALGITKSALYKYFESKEALWNEMIDFAERYYGEMIGAISGGTVPGDWSELRELSLRQIRFTLHDETVGRVRKLLTLEQYRSDRVAALATKHFLTDMEASYKKIFVGMKERGRLKSADPELLAFQYTAPITVLVHLCDREPNREAEIMNRIEAHIRQFAIEHDAERCGIGSE